MAKRLEADEGASANRQRAVKTVGRGVPESTVGAGELTERLGYEVTQALHGVTRCVTPECQLKESKSAEPHPCGEVLFSQAKVAIARRHLPGESCPGQKLHPSLWLTARSTKSSIIGRIRCRNQLVKRHERPAFDKS